MEHVDRERCHRRLWDKHLIGWASLGRRKEGKRRRKKSNARAATEPRMKEPFCLQAHFVLHDFGKLEFVPHLSP